MAFYQTTRNSCHPLLKFVPLVFHDEIITLLSSCGQQTQANMKCSFIVIYDSHDNISTFSWLHMLTGIF